MIDTSILEAKIFVPFKEDRETIRVYLIGCGGTGSWLAPHLARITKILESGGKSLHLTFIDHDIVEEKNIVRQNFCYAEIGANKAETLALRYSGAYGVRIRAFKEPFQKDMLNVRNNKILVIGCVDNAYARLKINEAVHEAKDYHPRPVWIDSGNAALTGQVLIGNSAYTESIGEGFKKNNPFNTALPFPSIQMPDLIFPDKSEQPEEDLGCIELMIRNNQSLAINQTMANIVSNYIIQMFSGSLKMFQTYTNLISGVTRSEYITPKAVARAIGILEPDYFEEGEKTPRIYTGRKKKAKGNGKIEIEDHYEDDLIRPRKYADSGEEVLNLANAEIIGYEDDEEDDWSMEDYETVQEYADG